MKQHAFTMKLKPGYAQEYKRRHDEIWPELVSLLTASGVSDYAIYLDEKSNTLFAVQKLAEDFDSSFLPNHPIVKKWWAYMADIMETNLDNSPVEGDLKEVFYLQ
ncbi:L-rhamnose mutarotase [Croceivirga radicis]|nr:L-rhamnose mutarotase [Croceivirga radicis]